MSWGERSCKNRPCPIPDKCTILTCNVDCPEYESNGKKPDSVPSIGRYESVCCAKCGEICEVYINSREEYLMFLCDKCRAAANGKE